jgi:hypothetical protein
VNLELKLREHRIVFKPLVVMVSDEREALFKKLKAQKDEMDLIIENPDVDVKLKLKAMDVSLRIAKAMAGVLKTIEAEKIKADIEELKKVMSEVQKRQNRERKRLQMI